MSPVERPFLLDVTRLISRGWTRRRSTGIDRVCYAYLRHFGARARAVVQHRGVFRILTPRHSDGLFGMLGEADGGFRGRFSAFAPGALAVAPSRIDGEGAAYINVSHTDFDLDGHSAWIERCDLRPAYFIHDLIPITHPEHCTPHAVARHRGRVINALRNAAGIIVNSAATARELAGFADRQGLRQPPILAAQLAGAHLRAPGASPADAGTYFLCVGTIESRKNHLMLLDLWRQLAARMGEATPRLIIAGQWGANAHAVRERLRTCPVAQVHVTLVPRCDDAELGALIAGARALLMPSLAEGFGLPMVEALKLGTPVIANDLPSFREIGQGIPTLIAAGDLDAWERMIAGFGDAHPERLRQRALMPGFEPPGWDRHFADVEAWLGSLPPRRRDRQEWRAEWTPAPAAVRSVEDVRTEVLAE